MAATTNAQDEALAALARRRGLLDDSLAARARAAADDLAAKGERLPLAQVFVRGGVLRPRQVTDLLRELALGTFRCRGCGTGWSYDALARLEALRCERCHEPIEQQSGEAPVLASHSESGPPGPGGDERASTAVQRAGERTERKLARERPASAHFRSGGSTAPSAGAAPAVGAARTVGPYEIEREIGRGSMGVVYLARRAGLERHFALKVLIGGEHADPDAVRRFDREARVASRIDHPGIVSVVDLGQAGDLRYYAMEYCRGETLQSLLRKGTLDFGRAARLVREVADAAAAAHRAGVVHRDLKPANIIVEDGTGRPRITDFGLARDSKAARGLTRAGDLLGTPFYMPPEQVRGDTDIDARADVYALGVILYECVSGRRPFEAPSAALLATEVLNAPPRPLSEANADVPPTLEAIAMKAIARERARRYADAAELRDDLDRFLRGDGPLARPRSFLAARFERIGPGVGRALSGPIGGVLAALVVLAAGTVVLARWEKRREDADRARREEEAERRKREAAEAEALRRAREEAARAEAVKREVDEKLKAADALARGSSPGEAFPALEQARQAHRGHPLVELAWAQLCLRRRRLEDAVRTADGLLAKQGLARPVELAARHVLSEALAERGDERAREALVKLAALDPRGSHGLLAQARLLAAEGKREEARRKTDEAIRAGGAVGNASPSDELARAHAFKARLAADEYAIERAIPRYLAERSTSDALAAGEKLSESALRHAGRAIDLAPDDAYAYLGRASARINLDYYRNLATGRLDPRDPRLFQTLDGFRADLDRAVTLAEPTPDPRALLLRGRLRLFTGTGDAGEDLSRAVKTLLELGAADDAASPWASYLAETLVLHALLMKRTQADLGDDDLKRAFRVAPRAAWAIGRHLASLRVPGNVLEMMRDSWRSGLAARAVTLDAARSKSIEERAAKAFPEVQEKVRTALRAAERGEPLAVARPPLDQARAEAPADPCAALELVRLLLGRGASAEAVELAERVRALGGMDPLALSELRAEALRRAGRAAEAHAAFADVAAKAQGARKEVALARAAQTAGELEPARHHALEACKGDPEDATVHATLASVLLDLRDPVDADHAWAEAELAFAIQAGADADVVFLRAVAPIVGIFASPSALSDHAGEQAQAHLDRSLPELDRAVPRGSYRCAIGRLLLELPAGPVKPLARVQAEAALGLDPKDVAAHLLLGYVRALDGQPGPAAESWKRARELSPKAPIPERWLASLKDRFPQLAKEFGP